MNHRSANRRGFEHSTAQVGRSEPMGRLNIKPELHDGSPRGFIEDFNLEHSVSGASRIIRTRSVTAIQPELGTRRGPYAQNISSPSCVYLG